ncbi:hypothetical protein J3F83DRAFT_17398 [Trichoderma novae-zelandiae]
METIPEVEGDATKFARADPEFPPLYYVQSPENSGIYIRSFKLSPNVFPPYLQPIPHYMKIFVVMDPATLRGGPPSAFPPLFFYSASKPLPAGFHIPYRGRPDAFYVSLTHDASLVNIIDSFPRLKSNAATDKALRTTELLESIFLMLDPVTVLTRIQRVNKAWKQVVDGSMALQRKLYLKPDGNAKKALHPQAKWLKDDRKEYPVINSILVRHFGSCFFNFGGVYGKLRRAESFFENRWTPHHHRLKKVEMPWTRQKVYKPMCNQELDGLSVLQASQDRERFTRAGASWRKMLVCQPPIFNFGVMIFEPIDGISPLPQKMERAVIKAHDMDVGLCMGQLYDFVQERASKHPLDSLWFRLVWFKPHGPWTSNLCHETAKDLALETGLIVEMFHKGDFFPGYHPPDPPTPDSFDSIFQCDDFKPHRWIPDAIAVDYAHPGYNQASPLVDGDNNMIWCGFSDI